MNEIFMINRRIGFIRIGLLIILSGVVWAVSAYLDHPFTRGAEPLTISILVYSAQALFAASVVRKIIMIALAFWLAYQVASHYLDYIFQLNDLSAAGKFLRQAAFASEYDTLDIRDGGVAAEHQHLPLFRIGGPGKIRVYLENAAVYEKIAGKTIGEPHVIGPTVSAAANPQAPQTQNGPIRKLLSLIISILALGKTPGDRVVTIEGFERLREVVDLRNHVLSSLEVVSRTRDGIRVNARDVNALVHVQRSEPESDQSTPRSIQHNAAIKKYVYRKTCGNEPDLVNSITYLLEKSIENKVFDDFLSSTINETEQAGSKPAASILSGLQSSLVERGIEISWIGEGTWETPYVDMTGRRLEAWQISRDNRLRGSETVLKGVVENAAVKEFLRLLQEIPIAAYHQLVMENEPQVLVTRTKLVKAYYNQIQSALDIFKLENKETDSQAILLAEIINIIETHSYHVMSELQNYNEQPDKNKDHPFDPDHNSEETGQEPAFGQDEWQPDDPPSKSAQSDAQDLYNRLIKLADGNSNLVDQRIKFERNRQPSTKPRAILRYLVDHWADSDQ